MTDAEKRVRAMIVALVKTFPDSGLSYEEGLFVLATTKDVFEKMCTELKTPQETNTYLDSLIKSFFEGKAHGNSQRSN